VTLLTRSATVAGLGLACALGATPAGAAMRHVPADYPTAAAALAAASPGDTVGLAPGTYAESLSLPQNVSLIALGAPGSATIAAPGTGPALDTVNPTAISHLVGLALTGGRGVNDGGATEGGNLRVLGGTLDVVDCSFASGQAAFGGGTAAIAAAVHFTRCTWSGGSATFGAGHFQSGGALTLTSCTFEGGTATDGGGLFATGGAQVTISTATFHACQATSDGGGLWFDSCVATLSDARFDGTQAGGHGGGCSVAAGGQVIATRTVWVETRSGTGGGAFHVSCAASAPGADAPRAAGWGAAAGALSASCALLTLTHCDVIRAAGAAPAAGAVTDAAVLDITTSIVAGNTSGLACLDPRATLDVSCSDLFENSGADVSGSCAPAAGANLLAVDPYLCDLTGRNFGLCANSPLLSPPSCAAYWGAVDQACAACSPTPAAVATWGRLKALYRH
jgi:hypothetical protein